MSEAELTSDDLKQCQQIGDYARDARYDGVLAPSAALADNQTIAVFASAMRKVAAGLSHVGKPPARVRRLVNTRIE